MQARTIVRRRALLAWVLCLALKMICLPTPALAQSPAEPTLEYRGGRPADWLTRRTGTPTLAHDALKSLAGPVDFAHYPTYQEIREACSQWEAEYPDLVRVTDIGASWQGRSLLIMRLGNEATGDPDARPALYIDAQHHAREPVSQQAALYFARWLLDHYATDPLIAHLLNTRTVYILPAVNADGNDLWLTTDVTQRRTANPSCDDDSDGLFDEDPAENLGYGSHERYRMTFDADWAAAHADNILASGWRYHIASSTYVGSFDAAGQLSLQQDNDGDGQTNEDAWGGVDPNRNYDIHWDLGNPRVNSEIYRGLAPFSEPETRAVRDFVTQHRNIATGVTLHSGIDMILYPWSWTSAETSPVATRLEAIARKGSELTACNGYEGSRYGQASVALYYASGTTGDWLHDAGIYSWSPEVYGGDEYFVVERVGQSNEYLIGSSLAGMFDPSPDELPPLLDRWRRFLVYILAATPNLGVTSLDANADQLWIEAANDGYIPVEVTLRAEDAQGELVSTLWAEASAGRRRFSVPLTADTPDGVITVTLSSTVIVGSHERTIEEERLLVHMHSDGDGRRSLWVEGPLMPWMDLSPLGNGNWEADAAIWGSLRYRTVPPKISSAPARGLRR